MSPDAQGRHKRSLILAGGGIKVAFQAGVMQVWLDEAGLTFDHADGASGGTFNLAMLCQGMTGKQIADNWRKIDPKAGVSLNLAEFPKLLYAESLFTLDNYRRNVFTAWGLDWKKINASPLNATFNVFNFSRKEVRVLEPREMSEDMLAACVSLPMWFPPAHIGGDTYIDAVYMTDANLEEAIRRGADELWVIWTVSEKDEWHPGFIATYFQIIETSADGHYKAILKRITANNDALAHGGQGEFGRRIEVKELKAEVPLHYLIDFSPDRMAEAVNLGVQRGREWCRAAGIPLKNRGQDYPVGVRPAATKLSFTEEMKGFFTLGDTDFDHGFRQGEKDGNSLMFHLTLTIDDVDTFVTRPDHGTPDVVGYVKCDALGGQMTVESGFFNLFVDGKDPALTHMLYRLFFKDGKSGQPLTLSGYKLVREDPNVDAWQATTTLFTRILKGHVSEAEQNKIETDPRALGNITVGSGIIVIHLLDFLKQLTTFRVEGPSVPDRLSAFGRFGKLFMGKLWDVYAQDILTSGPF
ncbi:MAG: patatin-like phospholipase family protein [Candidatus Binataceae bacterium]